MKKLFFVCALSAASFSLFAFAPISGAGSYKARENFKAEFGAVSDVNWESSKKDLTKASFTVDNQLVTAFFDHQGELVATTVSMTRSQLPLKLRTAIDQELAGADIQEIFSVETSDESSYYISTDAGKKLYKAYANGTIREVSKYFLK